jgi:hypothetical protein
LPDFREAEMFLYKHFLGPEHAGSEVEDIARNLAFVLKTKRGCGYFLQNFGLSEVGHRTPEEMVVGLTAEIEENIRLFEPRVVVVGVDEEYGSDGGRTKLVVMLRPRDAKERLSIVVDLRTKTVDVQPVKKR